MQHARIVHAEAVSDTVVSRVGRLESSAQMKKSFTDQYLTGGCRSYLLLAGLFVLADSKGPYFYPQAVAV